MFDFPQKMLNKFPDPDDSFQCATPAAGSPFSVDPKSPPLDTETAKLFCALTAKGLFASKRCRPNVQVPVAFLTTRVRNPTKQDWFELKCLLGCLRAAIGVPHTLKLENSSKILTCSDSSFAIHTDMRGHTGMATTMGKGAILSLSGKQRLDTQSSTESKIAAVDEGIVELLWSQNLLLTQNCPVSDCILFQDNQAGMKSEKHSFTSSGKQTKHFEIQFWFATKIVCWGTFPWSAAQPWTWWQT